MRRKPRTRQRGHAPAPLQKALEPGSQDQLRPLNNPRGERDHPPQESREINLSLTSPPHHPPLTPPSAPPPLETCPGKWSRDHRLGDPHQDPTALVTHLQQFLGLRGAPAVVHRYGVLAVNEALEQMQGNSELRNPAGFFTWLVRHLAEAPAPRERSVRGNPQSFVQQNQEVPHGDR